MRLKAALKFETREFLSTILAVYGVMILINTLGIVIQKMTWGGIKTNITFNGIEMILIVTVFIIAAAGFSEEFQMLIQNGVSRKNIFKSKICAALLLSVILSVADRVFFFITRLIADIAGVKKSAESIWNQVYSGFADGQSVVLSAIVFTVLGFIIYFFTYLLGTAISGLVYRLSKRGCTILAVSLTVTGLLVIPLLLEFFWDTAIMRWLADALSAALGVAKGIPYPAMVSFAVLACICGAASWAVLRKAVPKE